MQIFKKDAKTLKRCKHDAKDTKMMQKIPGW
jgi:hypothetical protein